MRWWFPRLRAELAHSIASVLLWQVKSVSYSHQDTQKALRLVTSGLLHPHADSNRGSMTENHMS